MSLAGVFTMDDVKEEKTARPLLTRSSLTPSAVKRSKRCTKKSGMALRVGFW